MNSGNYTRPRSGAAINTAQSELKNLFSKVESIREPKWIEKVL
jgi:hypothetical protein